MESETVFVLREHARLDRPNAVRVGRFHQCSEKEMADSATAGGFGHIDGVLNDARIHTPRRGGSYSRPSEYSAIIDRHKPKGGELAGIE